MIAQEFIENYSAFLDEEDGITSLIKLAAITMNRACFISLIGILDKAGIDTIMPRIQIIKEDLENTLHNYNNTSGRHSIITLDEYLKTNFTHNLELPQNIVDRLIKETIENNI